MTKTLNIKVILGSTRPTRFGIQPAEWIVNEAKKIESFNVELIDLKSYPLPFFDEEVGPSRIEKPYEGEIISSFTKKMAEADGFIMVTPEYNHGPSAVLKNALDYVYKEWNRKPVAFASYGSVGGARAIEQLRQIVIELQMVPIKHSLNLTNHWANLDENGILKTDSYQNQMEPMLKELECWAQVLKTAKQAN